jgi:hypothetical protein
MTNRPILLLAFMGLVAACEREATVTSEQGKLTLEKPADVKLERGGSAKASIEIERKNMPGEVRVKFDHLPRGVEVSDSRNTLAGDQSDFMLRASESADLVEAHVAHVTVTGPDGNAVTQPIEITVVERSP